MSKAYRFLLEFIPIKIGAGMTFLEEPLSLAVGSYENYVRSYLALGPASRTLRETSGENFSKFLLNLDARSSTTLR